jgi:hypothetical protein
MVGAVIASALIATAIAGSTTHWFGLSRPVANSGAAQTLCENLVRHDLLAPGTATFLNLYIKRDRLSEDDNASLGADARRVREVWGVGGDVESSGQSGAAARSRFTCKAYIFKDNSSRATVNRFDSDESGQWQVKP